MARIDGFGYLPGDSPFHRLDPRVKLIAVALWGVILAGSDFAGLAVMSVFFLASLSVCGISLDRLPTGLAFLSILLAVFLTRTFSAAGPPLFQVGPAMATVSGVVDGARMCGRLWLIAALGAVLTLTTRPAEARAAIEWFLRPIPFVPERRVSVMMAMMLRLIPMVLGQARLTADAQRARCVENRKNPVFRLTVFMTSFLRGVFLRADRMALALEARGFSETDTGRTEPVLAMERFDRWAMAGIVALAGLVFGMDRLAGGGIF